MQTYPVSISKNDHALTAVQEALELLGGLNQYVQPGDRVWMSDSPK